MLLYYTENQVIVRHAIMQQSFVTTAPPPTGKGRDYDFSVSVPCYEPNKYCTLTH